MKKLIKEFINHEKTKGQKAKSTIENYQRYLTKFSDYAGDIEPTEVNLDLIDGFQKSLIKNKAGISTQHYYLIAIRVFLKWLRVRKNLDCLDPEKIELPKIHRKIKNALTDKEADSLLKSAIPQNREGVRDRLILELLIFSGPRVSELTNLKISDLNLENKTALVTGKGDKTRQIYLTEPTIHFIKKHLEVRNCESDYLFNTRGGEEKLTARSIQRLIKRSAEKALIKRKVTPHDCRHFFASQMLNKGLNIRQVQTMLGHSSIQTTEIYTHVTDPELKKAFKMAHSSFNNKPDGTPYKNEFVVMSKENFYKLTGMISQNRQLLLEINRKLNESK